MDCSHHRSLPFFQFFFLDAADAVEANPDRSSAHHARDLQDIHDSQPSGDSDDLFKRKKDLYGTLLRNFTHMRKIPDSKLDHGNYAVVNVAPSVVPNPYLPSFRIFSYNISGTPYLPEVSSPEVEGDRGGAQESSGGRLAGQDEECYRRDDSSSRRSSRSGDGQPAVNPRESGISDCKRRRRMQTWNSSPNSPSRRNTLWSPLGYAQYYMPDLNGSRKHPPKYKLEYVTFKPANLHPPRTTSLNGSEDVLAEDESAKEKFWYPIPLRHLPRSLRNGTAVGEKKKSKFAPYKMEDLTIPEWLKLARKLGRAKKEKLRRKFRQYMYMGADAE